MIFLGADHKGFKLKEALKPYLKRLRVDFEDLGNFVFDPKDDYPDFALRLAKQVAQTKGRGILICGSGAGVCMAANKLKGIRAAQASSVKQARAIKREDDANILCLAADELSFPRARQMVRTWLATKFSGLPRHQRRLQKISQIEKASL